jgi:adenylate kinase
MKYYIIFGPPGAGKGTQSRLLTEKYGLRHISTGELLRKEIETGTETGIIAKDLIDRGKFVEDHLIIEMVQKEICNVPENVNGFIFDGFPRTISQAEAFDKILHSCGNDGITAVISLVVEDSVIVERIRKRAGIEGRMDDASTETILNRIKTYHNKTEPLIAYYREQGKYYPVRGEQSVEEIFGTICNLMEKIHNEQ